MNIALTGKARSGKDTVARVLVEEYGYRRVAFADALKEMALEINPIIACYTKDGYEIVTVPLVDLVEFEGWELAKDIYPEVRRFLQQLGSSVRKRNPMFWVGIVEEAIEDAEREGVPVVVTDCRYFNEANTLQEHYGFSLIRITRPGVDSGDTHESETEMDGYEVDYELLNDSDIAALKYYASTMTKL